jgi:hypothetical protein
VSNNEQIISEALNATAPKGYPEGGTLVSIEFIQGFERFGAYEDWGKGWRISGRDVTVERKNLNAAVSAWALTVWEKGVVA